MGENSKIEWTRHTFNLWRRNPKTLGVWGPNGTRVMAAPAAWRQPLRWDKRAGRSFQAWQNMLNLGHSHADLVAQGFIPPERHRVFCASLADVFEDWTGPILDSNGQQWFVNDVGLPYRCKGLTPSHWTPPLTMNDVRRNLFALIDATPNLDWLLLTKRPENVLKMWAPTPGKQHSSKRKDWYRSNVWLGTSISDQATADVNVPELLKCRDLSPVLFLSAEPLLAAVEIDEWLPSVDGTRCLDGEGDAMPLIDWVICGGESGHHARPMHPQWARDLRDQCQAAGVPYFFKQHGEWAPIGPGSGLSLEQANGPRHWFEHSGVIVHRVGKKAAGRLLDGRTWDEFPEAHHV